MAKSKRLSRVTVEIDGQKHKIAKVGRGVSIPLKEKLIITKLICDLYEQNEYPLSECCQAVNIDVRTFHNWRNEFSEISDLYVDADNQRGKVYSYRLRELARTAAEKLLTGHVVKVTEREAEAVQKENGETVMETRRVKQKEIYVRPSANFTAQVLYNTDARVFEKNPKPIDKINKDVDIPVINWVNIEDDGEVEIDL